MAKKSKRRCDTLPVLHPDAAGIDVGASELYIAVSAGRNPQPVRSFPTFTRDLHALADWLVQCGIRSMAMESTSVYWIPVQDPGTSEQIWASVCACSLPSVRPPIAVANSMIQIATSVYRTLRRLSLFIWIAFMPAIYEDATKTNFLAGYATVTIISGAL